MTDEMQEKVPLPVRKPGKSLRRLRASGREPLAPDGPSAEGSTTTGFAVRVVPVNATTLPPASHQALGGEAEPDPRRAAHSR